MDAKRKKFSFIGLILALVLAFEVFFVLDMLFSRASSNLSPVLAALTFAAVLIGGLALEAFSPRAMSIVFLVITALILLAALFFGIIWYKLYGNVYPALEKDKAAVFADKRVMLIVPHEGDEQLALSGVIEQYLDYDSQLWAVYVNDEALNYSLASCGVDASRIFRLAPDETLGAELKNLILRVSPDAIYCVDYGGSAEYEELSLCFEQVMGQVLKQKTGYNPAVFKALLNADSIINGDFYGENISSIKYSGETDYMPENTSYIWSERLRLPVAEETISRSMYSAGSYNTLAAYGMDDMADNIISGDKVFWQRETDSMSYDLEFWTSSGDEKLLNDFVLSDPNGIWIPEKDDTEKRIIIKFADSTAIDRIVLYDNPSLTDNVLDVALRFDDGTFIMTGALEPNGSGTDIQVNKNYVSELEIVLMDTDGDAAGLAEAELYSESYEAPFSLIKIVNADGDFVYDYYMDAGGTEEFRLYTYGCSDDLADYRVICMGDECSAIADGDIIRVSCPEGKSCTLTVMDKSGTISDTAQIHNEKTWHITLAQSFEKFIREEFREGVINSNSSLILRTLRNTLKGSNT